MRRAEQAQRALDGEARGIISIKTSLLIYHAPSGHTPVPVGDDKLRDLGFVIMQTTDTPPGTLTLWGQLCPRGLSSRDPEVSTPSRTDRAKTQDPMSPHILSALGVTHRQSQSREGSDTSSQL